MTTTHSGNFVAGSTGQYTITVSNAAGMEREDNTVTVTDTLPTGLTFNSAQRHRLELQRRRDRWSPARTRRRSTPVPRSRRSR